MIHIHSQALNFVYYNFLKLWWGIKHKTNTTRTKLTWMLKSRNWNDKRKNLGKKMTIQGWNLDFSQFCKLKKKWIYIMAFSIFYYYYYFFKHILKKWKEPSSRWFGLLTSNWVASRWDSLVESVRDVHWTCLCSPLIEWREMISAS